MNVTKQLVYPTFNTLRIIYKLWQLISKDLQLNIELQNYNIWQLIYCLCHCDILATSEINDDHNQMYNPMIINMIEYQFPTLTTAHLGKEFGCNDQA